MSSLSFQGFAVASDSGSHSRIVDLEWINIGGVTQLYSATRYDGVVQHWQVDSGPISLGAAIDFAGPLLLGGSGGRLTAIEGTEPMLLTGGADQGGLQLISLGTDGGPTGTTNLAAPDSFTGFQHTSSHTVSDGTQIIFGAIAGTTGIGRLQFDSSGAFLRGDVLQDATALTAAQIAGTAVAQVGGQSFLLSISGAHGGITSRQIDESGNLSAVQSIDAANSLWIDAPTALAVATIGTSTYAVIGAANTDSLSVVEIAADGSMIVRDHVMDTRDTRFAGVTAVEVVESVGRTYVVAGGADDGVSVFLLLEGGLLVHRDQIADTIDVSLDNISALAARGRGVGLDIFAASSSEAGVTQIHFDTGTIGATFTATLAGGPLTGTLAADILQGHDGNDMIFAGAGDDIIRDGGGRDTLTGGTGADVFLFSADGETDTITDFMLGEDAIDLSLWPMLRDKSQLFITATSDGMQITYGDEVLIVQSADGAPIDYRVLQNSDLLGGSRLPVDLTPGYPGPAIPVIDPDGPAAPPDDQTDTMEALSALQLIALNNVGAVRQALGTPEDAADINGTQSADLIDGTDAGDLIFAGDGADVVIAGNGNDLIFGRGGDDYLAGGFGNDWLWGGAGADTFVFNGGVDIIDDYSAGVDDIILDARLWTGLTSAADLLLFNAEMDETGTTITFDTGDTLFIAGALDIAALADDITLF